MARPEVGIDTLRGSTLVLDHDPNHCQIRPLGVLEHDARRAIERLSGRRISAGGIRSVTQPPWTRDCPRAPSSRSRDPIDPNRRSNGFAQCPPCFESNRIDDRVGAGSPGFGFPRPRNLRSDPARVARSRLSARRTRRIRTCPEFPSVHRVEAPGSGRSRIKVCGDPPQTV